MSESDDIVTSLLPDDGWDDQRGLGYKRQNIGVDIGLAAVRLLEVTAFAAVNGGIAAALRGWFKWPRVPERTIALVVALLLTSPLTVGALALRDLLFITFAFIAIAIEYAGLLIGLRLTRPH